MKIGFRLGLALLLSPSAVLAHDVADELARVEGLTIVEEQPVSVEGYRFFVLSFTQPIDHLDPASGTFEQRLSLLHHDSSAPTVAFTTGYDLPIFPFRSEPASLAEGNQLGIEERFFLPSRPEPADFGDLNIFQAAADHHRVIEALKPLYPGKWLSTGASKGGMASVYHRRFFPHDVDGSVIYVAPNDAVDADDAYGPFLEARGTAECRDSLRAVQRAALERRDSIVPVLRAVAEEAGLGFEIVGSADRAFELTVVEVYFTFWQYLTEADCAIVPPPDAPLDELLDFISLVVGLLTYTDEGIEPYIPYYYQAGTQLGYPDMDSTVLPLADLRRYPNIDSPRNLVPADIPMTFDPSAAADIDRWVRSEGSELLFLYGENDPWGAERFELGSGTRDSAVYEVAGGNHYSSLVDLPPAEQLAAANTIRRWAGLAPLEPAEEPESIAPGVTPFERAARASTAVEALVHATALDRPDVIGRRRRL